MSNNETQADVRYDRDVERAAQLDLKGCKRLMHEKILIGVMCFDKPERMETGIAYTGTPDMAVLWLLDHAVRLSKLHGLNFDETLAEVRKQLGYGG